MKGGVSSILSKKPKPDSKEKRKQATVYSGTEDVYTIPDRLPKTVVMSREMKRRQDEELLRAKHGVKKDKSATIT